MHLHAESVSWPSFAYKYSELSVGFNTRLLIKSFKTILKGSFFRSAVTSDMFTSRRVDFFSVSGQFPCPSISNCHRVFVVITPKVERAKIAEIIKPASRVAVGIDSPSLMFH